MVGSWCSRASIWMIWSYTLSGSSLSALLYSLQCIVVALASETQKNGYIWLFPRGRVCKNCWEKHCNQKRSPKSHDYNSHFQLLSAKQKMIRCYISDLDGIAFQKVKDAVTYILCVPTNKKKNSTDWMKPNSTSNKPKRKTWPFLFCPEQLSLTKIAVQYFGCAQCINNTKVVDRKRKIVVSISRLLTTKVGNT